MRLPVDFMPEFGSLTNLLLDMAQERSVLSALNILVNRFSQRPAIAMTQIWLKRKADNCNYCRFSGQCLNTNICLHLVASASRYQHFAKPDESENQNFSNRIPMGYGMVGQVVTTGKQVVINDLTGNLQLFELPQWTVGAEMVSFLCQPIQKNNSVLGALAIYLRMAPVPEGIVWSRVIADHAAAAIANSLAFDEIQALKGQVELENQYLREEVNEARALGDIIGQSKEILDVIRQIDLVAPTDTTVLISGESGTGKELVAREIHKRSHRKDRAIIKINCASIASELYESEFFGHAKGAFTGALKDRAGRFQAADKGTLFLDEVGEIPFNLQSKLLRTLQDGSYERVGEEITRFVDVRIIAATNKNLEDELFKNRFRKDLYYRLNVFPIEIAPLRMRKEDISLLAENFLQKTCAKLNRPQIMLTNKNIAALQEYDWPGNVRELQNVIERAVITIQSGRLFFNLPTKDTTRMQIFKTSESSKEEDFSIVLTEAEIKKREKENILTALHRSKGKIYGIDGAANLLQIKPTTLCARIKKLELK